jgi:hypothetical protein
VSRWLVLPRAQNHPHFLLIVSLCVLGLACVQEGRGLRRNPARKLATLRLFSHLGDVQGSWMTSTMDLTILHQSVPALGRPTLRLYPQMSTAPPWAISRRKPHIQHLYHMCDPSPVVFIAFAQCANNSRVTYQQTLLCSLYTMNLEAIRSMSGALFKTRSGSSGRYCDVAAIYNPGSSISKAPCECQDVGQRADCLQFGL